MIFKEVKGTFLLTLVPIALFVMLAIYLITSDPNVIGPY